MNKRVLLVALTPSVLAGAREELERDAEIELLPAAGAQDVRAAFAQGDVDHVILGGGLDLETRVAVVRAVFESSDCATVHLKDHQSGPEGYLPFIRSVLAGFRDYDPPVSPKAVPRAQR